MPPRWPSWPPSTDSVGLRRLLPRSISVQAPPRGIPTNSLTHGPCAGACEVRGGFSKSVAIPQARLVGRPLLGRVGRHVRPCLAQKDYSGIVQGAYWVSPLVTLYAQMVLKVFTKAGEQRSMGSKCMAIAAGTRQQEEVTVMNAKECPMCSRGRLVEISLTLAGEAVAMSSCSNCDTRWWHAGGEERRLSDVLELAASSRR